MRERLAPIAAAAIALLVSLPTMNRGISLGDEGHLLAIASRLAHGEGTLYKDIATNIPPLSYDTLAFAFRIFGETLQVERTLGVACVALTAAACFMLGQSRGGPVGGVLSVLAFLGCKAIAFPHWSVFYYTECSVMLALFSLAVVERVGEQIPSARAIVLSGSLAALSAGFKQNFGAFALIAIGVALWRRGARVRCLALFFAPALFVASALMVDAALRGALLPFIDWNVIYFLGRFSSDLSIPYPRPLGAPWPGKPVEVALFYYLPGSLGVPRALALPLLRTCYLLPPLALVFLLRRLREPLALFALLSLSALLPLADFSHYQDAMLPALLVASRGTGSRGARLLSVVCSASLAIAGTAATIRTMERLWTPVSFGERGHVLTSPEQAADLSRASEALARIARPGDPILCLPYCPLFYFTGGYRNPTFLYLPFPSVLTAEGQDRVIREAAGVRVLVVDGARWPHLPPFEASAPRIDGWMGACYVPCERAGTLSILCRR